MAFMTSSMFVRFASNDAPDGFDPTRYYQVYAIDVCDDGDGEITYFLLADKHGRYEWIDKETLRRFNPRSRKGVVIPPSRNHRSPAENYPRGDDTVQQAEGDVS